MKVTKSYLKQIIKEEINRMLEMDYVPPAETPPAYTAQQTQEVQISDQEKEKNKILKFASLGNGKYEADFETGLNMYGYIVTRDTEIQATDFIKQKFKGKQVSIEFSKKPMVAKQVKSGDQMVPLYFIRAAITVSQ